MERMIKNIKNYENKIRLKLLEELLEKIKPWMIDEDFKSIIKELKERYRLYS